MNILAFNTAFRNANIALTVDNQEKFLTIDSSMKHSENLLPSIEECLIECGQNDLQNIQSVAVVVGPGSFTGLRISIATAKAFVDTNPRLRAIKINSLELMAFEFFKSSKEEIAVFVLNALSGFYFIAAYDKELNEIIAPKMITKNELKQIKNTLVSDEKLEDLENIKISFNSQSLLEFAKNKAKKNQFCEEFDLVPLYLRPSQAEANLKR